MIMVRQCDFGIDCGTLCEHAVKPNPTGWPPGSDEGHVVAGEENGQ